MKADGCYAIYKGKEYRADFYPELPAKGNIMLVSMDNSDLDKGFKKSTIYGLVKKVKKQELDDAYALKSFAKIKGVIFSITDDEEKRVYVYSNSYNDFIMFDMEQFEPFVYHKWFDKTDVEEIWQEKRPIWGFEKGH